MGIRLLTPGDEALVARVVSERRNRTIEPASITPFLSDRRNIMFIALEGDDIAGYLVAYELDKFYGDRMLLIYDVEVAAEHHRKGIGRALIDAARNHCVAANINSMWLSTSRDDPRARGFYDALGGTVQEDVVYSWRIDGKSTAGARDSV